MDEHDGMPQDTERVQSALRQRPATIDDLLKKKPRTKVVHVPILDDDNNVVELTMRFEAISSRAYDDLVAKHKPTPEQKRENAAYNVDTFAPALIAAVSVEPKLSVEDATAIYNSDQWSGGEVSSLFLEAVRLCQAGFDVPFTGAG